MFKPAASPGPGGIAGSQPKEASFLCSWGTQAFWGWKQWLAKAGLPRRKAEPPVGDTAPSSPHSRNCRSFRPERQRSPTWGPCGTMTLRSHGGGHQAGQSCRVSRRGWQCRWAMWYLCPYPYCTSQEMRLDGDGPTSMHQCVHLLCGRLISAQVQVAMGSCWCRALTVRVQR